MANYGVVTPMAHSRTHRRLAREFFGFRNSKIKERLAKMKLEKISIDEIKPYANNAKLHPPEQIEQIKKSISEFGNNDPIAVDENNVIIEGYGRYEALKQFGFELEDKSQSFCENFIDDLLEKELYF